MRKLFIAVLTLTFAFATPLAAFASLNNDVGIWGYNDFSDSTPVYYRFGDEEEAVFIFDGVIVPFQYWDEVLPGSSIFIPIIIENPNGAESIATERQIRDNNVTISHVVAHGSSLVESVQMVDGRRDRINGLAPGMYARIVFANHHTGMYPAHVVVNMVLNVHRVSYPYTEIEVGVNLLNHIIYIDRSTVFGARIGTLFNVQPGFSGGVVFDMGGGVRYTAMVSAPNRYLIDFTTAPIEGIAEAYPDAHIEFRRFLGNNAVFASYGLLEIPINEDDFAVRGGRPQIFVYEVRRGSYNLTSLSSNVNFDRRAGVLYIRTRHLGEYVISNQSLHRHVQYPDDSDILQAGYASESNIVANAPEVPASALPLVAGAGINVTNVGTHNPPTGIRAAPLPLPAVAGAGTLSLMIVLKYAAEKLKKLRR